MGCWLEFVREGLEPSGRAPASWRAQASALPSFQGIAPKI